MELKTTNYTFWAEAYKDPVYSDEIVYNIGKQNGLPCIRLSVIDIPDTNKKICILCEVSYSSTCAKEGLEKKTGTIEMIQGAIKALFRVQKDIPYVEFTDKSYWETSKKGKVPIAERRVLAGRPTWYQEYLGAVPTAITRVILRLYEHASKIIVTEEILEGLGIRGKVKYIGKPVSFLVQDRYERWTEEQLLKLIQNLNIDKLNHLNSNSVSLSGSTWTISREVVRLYPKAKFMHYAVSNMAGGGSRSQTNKQSYSFVVKNMNQNYCKLKPIA
jgi:hypothetical protein